MHAKRELVFVIFVLVWEWAICICIEDYCRVNTETIPCLTKCKRAAKCGNTSDVQMALTPEERQEILNEHNIYREVVARGNYSAHYLPPSDGGIRALSYSLELEFLAACWINQCEFAHDKQRYKANGEKVGQNLHQIYSSAEVGWKSNFAANGIGSWFNEYKLLTSADEGLINKYVSRKGVGHLTAMLWGNTAFVGCAKMHFMQKRRGQPQLEDHAYNLYCNYWPRGNLLNTAVYKNKSCDMFNEEWPHLCGDIWPMEQDTFIMAEVGGAPETEGSSGRGGKKSQSGAIIAPALLIYNAFRNMF